MARMTAISDERQAVRYVASRDGLVCLTSSAACISGVHADSSAVLEKELLVSLAGESAISLTVVER
jgi:hypothetical protein